jgi:hypothetical protein
MKQALLVLCGLAAACVSADDDLAIREQAVKQTCGGFADLRCPATQTCVDDPKDSCDPGAGDLGCTGVCRRVNMRSCEPATCLDGYVWSDQTCSCEPAPATCPVDQIRCLEGYILDEPTCSCVPIPGDACGTITCSYGQVCCNASCGICVPPGGTCTQLACEPTP